MFVGFTIVTNSFLAHAKSLKESFLKHNPDFKFYIGLLDTPLPEEDLTEVVSVVDLGLEYLEEMHQRYSPFELSCAMKPYFASYFAERFNPDLTIYLDADIRVYASFEYLKNLNTQYAIFLTPHIIEYNPQNTYTELAILRAGIYNGGFFAVNTSNESKMFLTWWKEKLRTLCFDKPAEGIFVDQLWLNLVPLLHQKCHIVKHYGYNVAYWNLPERKAENVVFFHFSGHNIQMPELLSKYADTVINFENYPAFAPFFEDYKKSLETHDYIKYCALKSAWGTIHTNPVNVPKKRKSYLSVLWRAIRGEIVLEI